MLINFITFHHQTVIAKISSVIVIKTPVVGQDNLYLKLTICIEDNNKMGHLDLSIPTLTINCVFVVVTVLILIVNVKHHITSL